MRPRPARHGAIPPLLFVFLSGCAASLDHAAERGPDATTADAPVAPDTDEGREDGREVDGAAPDCGRPDAKLDAAPEATPTQAAYLQLLAVFPENRPGFGLDQLYLNENIEMDMTYGLVLSAESIRFRHAPTEEGRRRVRGAARWLIDNHVDGLGKPGWPWPKGYTTGQGTMVPPNTAYTIDAAIALDGLLDTLVLSDVWSADERSQIRAIMYAVVLRWCREFFIEGYSGGFLRYDPYEDFFHVNVSGMFLGAMVRLLKEHGDGLGASERALVEERADAIARAMVFSVHIRDGSPYWGAIPMPGTNNDELGHDLLHHVYTLSGIELYRDLRGKVKLPWTRAQAIGSIETFWYKDTINMYAANDPRFANDREESAILWCAGFMLEAYAQWGAAAQAARAFEAILRYYGPLPHLTYFAKGLPRPRDTGYQGDNSHFFPRHAAHVLLGFSRHAYGVR